MEHRRSSGPQSGDNFGWAIQHEHLHIRNRHQHEAKALCRAVYKGTLSHAYAMKSETAVLQLLHEKDHALVRKLGKASGNTIDKISYLQRKGALDTWKGFPVLSNACFTILLQKERILEDTGDHTLMVFRVVTSKVCHGRYLTTSILGKRGIIRI